MFAWARAHAHDRTNVRLSDPAVPEQMFGIGFESIWETSMITEAVRLGPLGSGPGPPGMPKTRDDITAGHSTTNERGWVLLRPSLLNGVHRPIETLQGIFAPLIY